MATKTRDWTELYWDFSDIGISLVCGTRTQNINNCHVLRLTGLQNSRTNIWTDLYPHTIIDTTIIRHDYRH